MGFEVFWVLGDTSESGLLTTEGEDISSTMSGRLLAIAVMVLLVGDSIRV